MEIHFTKHANEKFEILLGHKFKVKKSQAIQTVKQPEGLDYSRLPLIIAQKKINKFHYLRVVYKPESDVLSWEISKRPIDYAIEIGNMILHFSPDKVPVLVEILEAKKFLERTQKLVEKKPAPVAP